MKEHFTCHICDKNGIKYHYYKDYRALERHFRKQHFICEERSCLEQKFVVFATALDLRVLISAASSSPNVANRLSV